MPDDSTLRNLTRLRGPLPEGEDAGLESVDPRLALLNTLLDKNQLRDLAAEVEQLLDAGIYDIRPISMYLWVAFSESGLTALPDLFDTLTALVGVNMGAIGPRHKKVDHYCKRISWLMQKLADVIEYHDARRTPEWQLWTDARGPEFIDGVLERAHAFETTLDDRFAPIAPAFQKLTARLRAVSLSFRIPALPPVSIASPVISSVRPPTQKGNSARPTHELKVDARLGRAEVGVSHEFFALIQKLDAFASLVKKGDLARAAVVADDVMGSIDSFDPRVYFPELFSDFSELLSKHIEALESYWRDRDSNAWKAHSQFYRVDLRRFVGGG